MYVYLARVAALDAGVAQEALTLTLNRLCGSGLQAIVSAAQSILLGHADIAVGAGCQTARNAENFSASHWLLHVNGSVAICVGLPQSVWLLWRSAGPRRITCPDGNAGSLMSDENQLRLGARAGPTDLGR
jgi:hypothetical protein